MHRRGIAAALTGSLLIAGVACGGGEQAVLGVGNSGNRFLIDEVVDELAEALAEHPATPKVDDELVREIYKTVVEQARDGDLKASLVILELAAHQREAKD